MKFIATVALVAVLVACAAAAAATGAQSYDISGFVEVADEYVDLVRVNLVNEQGSVLQSTTVDLRRFFQFTGQTKEGNKQLSVKAVPTLNHKLALDTAASTLVVEGLAAKSEGVQLSAKINPVTEQVVADGFSIVSAFVSLVVIVGVFLAKEHIVGIVEAVSMKPKKQVAMMPR